MKNSYLFLNYFSKKVFLTCMAIVILALFGCKKSIVYEVSNPNVRLIKAAMYGDEAEVLNSLRNGADVNAVTTAGMSTTALIEASREAHLKIVKILIINGADVKIRNYFNLNAIDVAELEYSQIDNIEKKKNLREIIEILKNELKKSK